MFTQLPVEIQNYRFTKLIGRGGFSSVYLAEDLKYQSSFAAKVIDTASEENGDWVAYDAEVDTLMRLNHPHIIRLYDHFFFQKLYIVILELCPGGNLETVVSNGHGLSREQFLSYAQQIVSALAFCHEHKIAHHDIKLANVLLDQYGRVKLADFGISMVNSGGLSTSYSGSLQYESPEIFLKKPHDPFKADIWALGILFAFMINGYNPWLCDSLGKLTNMITKGNYHLTSKADPDIRELISKMVIVEPNQRISIKEVQEFEPFINMVHVPLTFEACQAPDALSPRARMLASPRNIIQNQSSNPHARTHSKEKKKASAKSIQICKLNILGGIGQPVKLKARYHNFQNTFEI